MTDRKKPRDDADRVDPLKGLLPWFGGKRELGRRLADMIDAMPHDCYAEPFLGMGGVFFRRRRRVKSEVVNDLSGDVVNLFRLVQRHPEALIEEMRWLIRARREFERLLKVDPTTLTDIERAARFYAIQRSNYGGIPINRSFPASPHRGRFLDPSQAMERLRLAHARLARVTIENLPYNELVRRYDRPGTLFYLDPPYWGDERAYGKGLFERADFERLADQLEGIKGRFILSMSDRPETRAVFGRFRLRKVMVTYRLRRVAKFAELIVTGPGRKG